MEQAHQVAAKLGGAPLHIGLSNAPKVILVVEDSPLIRLNAVSAFEEAGFRALEAESADAAIVLLLEDTACVSLVFTDVSMPGTLDGLQLVVVVRSRWPAIRLIVTSGRTIIEEGQLPENVLFFRKPYHDADIIGAAHFLLRPPDGTLEDT